jgi:hypothetical protein
MKPLRLGFLEWVDPLAWTEKNTANTRKAIQAENRNFKHCLRDVNTKVIDDTQKQIESYETGTLDEFQQYIPEENPEICIRWTKSAIQYTWTWTNQTHLYKADTIDTCMYKGEFYVAYTLESPKDGEDNYLWVRTRKSVWKYAKDGASSTAILDGRVYFIESDSPLKSYRVISLSLDTGRNRRVEYVETCHEIMLSLSVVQGGVVLH